MSEHTFIDKWAAGPDYGVALSPIELYVLQAKLEVNPLFNATKKGKHITYDIMTNEVESDLSAEDLVDYRIQPATLPRVTEIVLITRSSPWVTVARSETGVTIQDIFDALKVTYHQFITEAEMSALPARVAQSIQRGMQATMYEGYGRYPTPHTGRSFDQRIKRIHWLQGKNFVDEMHNDDSYIEKRLGYKAANMFVIGLLS